MPGCLSHPSLVQKSLPTLLGTCTPCLAVPCRTPFLPPGAPTPHTSLSWWPPSREEPQCSSSRPLAEVSLVGSSSSLLGSSPPLWFTVSPLCPGPGAHFLRPPPPPRCLWMEQFRKRKDRRAEEERLHLRCLTALTRGSVQMKRSRTAAWQMLHLQRGLLAGLLALWRIKVKCSGDPGRLWVICRLSHSAAH